MNWEIAFSGGTAALSSVYYITWGYKAHRGPVDHTKMH